MTRLQQLFEEQGQSPWLDNLKRGYLSGGQLSRMVTNGIRGVTSNPTIFAKAISGSDDYDEQFRSLVKAGTTVENAYWAMVSDDIHAALDLLLPLHNRSGGGDGFVSIELAPALAHDTAESVAAARRLNDAIHHPNLLVKIPATAEGVPAVRQMISEGCNINITLIFSLERYGEVIDAYLSGLEACTTDLSQVHSVASFFVSRVDAEVDRRLDQIGSPEAQALRGKAAVSQAKLAYRLFCQQFHGERWEALAARGARLQRPLWASTSTKDPSYPDTLYVTSLIGPDTINTLPEATIEAFEDHGTVACTLNQGVNEARLVMDRLAAVGIDLDDVGHTLEEEGVAAFAKSFDELLAALSDKATELVAG
ncbi:MAG: transaldolase [Acidimicrobiales bacterium]